MSTKRVPRGGGERRRSARPYAPLEGRDLARHEASSGRARRHASAGGPIDLSAHGAGAADSTPAAGSPSPFDGLPNGSRRRVIGVDAPRMARWQRRGDAACERWGSMIASATMAPLSSLMRDVQGVCGKTEQPLEAAGPDISADDAGS